MYAKLIEKAKARHNVEEIFPLPGRDMIECYVGEDGKHMLHYHLKNDDSSHMVVIEEDV